MSKPVSRDDIVSFCCTYLEAGRFPDSCVNGTQVQGADEVKKIVTGVSISLRLLREAASRGAQMVMVHHGLFQNDMPQPPVIKGHWRDRLATLLSHQMTLCGFHLPLDAHPEIGNNASICRALGIKNLKPIDVGFIGTLSRPQPFKQFVERVDRALPARSTTVRGTSPKVHRIAVISGSASGDYELAAEMGADTFLSGSLNEWEVRAMEEVGINFIHAGHYNTERFGIQNLGNLVAKKFKIPVEYVEVPCEV